MWYNDDSLRAVAPLQGSWVSALHRMLRITYAGDAAVLFQESFVVQAPFDKIKEALPSFRNSSYLLREYKVNDGLRLLTFVGMQGYLVLQETPGGKPHAVLYCGVALRGGEEAWSQFVQELKTCCAGVTSEG